ncbi:hypothetical protein VFPPC_12837 [Pochonia chlamydosporia 170]|uniref:Uncharacterized protein n=1 Tax=Pochonia chlamydosporia 170 TaxID=1380566 RepID=A0A179G4E6_METCM|nr:hypothetical protein VFPPC_12837 [Pochonia chlamydosporia 170]OAQ72726.1 hypothetical protein VFPPC_12837 [Pochonia chlamydosporia 170]
MRLIQSFLLIGLVALAGAKKHPAGIVLSVPIMPRIPSQAKHNEVLQARSALSKPDASAIVSTTCLDTNQVIDAHDEAEAQLSICGGMPGSIQACQGAPSKTEGRARTALFSLSVGSGDSIVITKQLWLRCVHAARSACPTGSLSAVCAGGASSGGNVAFTLTKP